MTHRLDSSRGLVRFTVALLVAGGLAACGPGARENEPDLQPPWVVSVEPLGETVDTEATFRVHFNEPVLRETIFWKDPVLDEEFADGVVLGLAENERSLVSASNNPPLSATQRARTVPMILSLDAGRDALTLTPTAPLEGMAEYVLVFSRRISDDRNNRLVAERDQREPQTVVFRFTTGPAPDRSRPQALLASPPAGATSVALDLPLVEVVFSKDIDPTSLRAGTVGLLERGTNIVIAPRSVQASGQRLTMRLDVRDEPGCHQLCPSRQYELFLTKEVRDTLGNSVDTARLITQVFSAADCLHTEPPRFAAQSVTHSVRDVSTRVSFRTDMPSWASVQIVAGDEDAFLAACEGEGSSCRETIGAWTSCSADVCALPQSPDGFVCAQSVVLDGLEPATRYTYRVVASDFAGRRTVGATRSFTTLPPIERVVLTELFASPAGFENVNEGRFVELYNDWHRPVNLAGWRLARCTEPTCTGERTNDWPMQAVSGAAELLPGQFAVAAGNVFDPVALGVPDDALRLRGVSSSTVVANGLTKGTAYAFALVRPDGVVVSTYGAHLGPPDAIGNDRRSFERLAPGAPDTRSSWSPSKEEIGTSGNSATPGRWNSSSGAAPGARAVLRAPAVDALDIPLDLAEVRIELNAAVPAGTLTVETIGLMEKPSGKRLIAEAVEISGRTVTLLLPWRELEGCGTLCPASTYAIWIDDEVKDSLGRPFDADFLSRQSFTTAACLDASPPRIHSGGIVSVAGFEQFAVSWHTDKPATARVQWVVGDADALEALCGEEPAEACRTASVTAAVCDVDVCALPEEASDFSCGQTLSLTKLRAGETYALRITVEDERGRDVSEIVEVTLPPPPRIVLTELMASPKLTGPLSNANHGKFVELFNADEVEVDLHGWRMVRCREPSCACPAGTPTGECYGIDWEMRGSGGTSVLGPDGLAVAAGIDANSLDWEAFEVPAGVLRLRSFGTGTTVLANGLVKGTSTSCEGGVCAYALLTPGHALVSSYGAHLGRADATANDGRSFERIDPLGPDVAENWMTCAADELEAAPGNRATAGRPNSGW